MKLSSRQLATAWFQALIDATPEQWTAISRRMLQHLYTRGELRRLREILLIMSRLEQEHFGTTAVTVRMAHPLPSELIDSVVHNVLPNTKPAIALVQDSSVIGGLQIETTNQRFDLSLRGSLRQLTHTLTN